jgi:outer membrane protein assembly factor BamC
MKHRIVGIVVVITASLLAGCSYLQSYFPDKERDYQYTTEIPMINYPADLRKNQSANGDTDGTEASANLDSNASTSDTSTDAALPPATDSALSEPSTDAATKSEPEVSATEVTPVNNADEHDAVSSVDIIKYDDGESRMRLGAGFSKSWRVVNKALSRNTIEVTERNHEQAQIAVQYDPDEKK